MPESIFTVDKRRGFAESFMAETQKCIIYYPQPLQLGHYILNCLSPLLRHSVDQFRGALSLSFATSPSSYLDSGWLTNLSLAISITKHFTVYSDRTSCLNDARQHDMGGFEIHGCEANSLLPLCAKAALGVIDLPSFAAETVVFVYAVRGGTRCLVDSPCLLEYLCNTITARYGKHVHVILDGMAMTLERDSDARFCYSDSVAEYTQIKLHSDILDKLGVPWTATHGLPLAEQISIISTFVFAISPILTAKIKYMGLLGLPTLSHGPLDMRRSCLNLFGMEHKLSGPLTSCYYSETSMPVLEHHLTCEKVDTSPAPSSSELRDWDVGGAASRDDYKISFGDLLHKELTRFLDSALSLKRSC